MIRRTHIVAAAIAALMAAFASQADAATVNLSDDGILTYAAAPGEANNALVTRVPGAFRVSDLGAPVNAGVNCQQSGGAVTCPSGGVRRIQAFTFDRGDQVRLLMAVAPPTIVDGGAGNDLVESRDATFESVSCGSGSDRAQANVGDAVAGDCEQVSLF